MRISRILGNWWVMELFNRLKRLWEGRVKLLCRRFRLVRVEVASLGICVRLFCRKLFFWCFGPYRWGRFPYSLVLAPIPCYHLSDRTSFGAGAISIPRDTEDESARARSYALFLRPARLRLWFHLYTWPLVLWFGYWLDWRWGLSVLLTMGSLYWIQYGWLRRPVLEPFWRDLPEALKPWILSLLEGVHLARGDGERVLLSSAPLDRRLRAGLRRKDRWIHARWPRWPYLRFRMPESRQAINYVAVYQPDRPPRERLQEVVLRLAIMDYMGRDANNQDGRPLLRYWLFWAAPAWMAFVVLLLPLLYQFFLQTLSPCFLVGILFPLLGWMALTIVFLARQSKYLGQDWSLSDAELEALPSAFTDWLARSGSFPRQVRRLGFIGIVALVEVVGLSLYLVLTGLVLAHTSSLSPSESPQCSVPFSDR